MAQPSLSTTKRLFALSGNRCAFPKCRLPMIDAESGKPTGRICHIKARNAKGPRYDPDQSEEERHAFENLVLMCPIHHDVIDADEETYTVERLHEIKSTHESTSAMPESPTDEQLQTLIAVSEINVAGSVIFAPGQSGGQVAHSIVNIIGGSHSAVTEREKARRYRLRKDLTQYLTRGSIEKDTFRILLQPTVDENGRRVDPTEKLGEAALRIQEWHSELVFYVHFRIDEDRALWLMSKNHGDGYPAGIGDVPGLSQSWDTVASGVSKVEHLLRELPEIPGGREASSVIESEWADTDDLIDWTVNNDESDLRVSLRAKRDLENPILLLHIDGIVGCQPDEEWTPIDRPILVGNKRWEPPHGFRFEVFGKWPVDVELHLVFRGVGADGHVTEVLVRFW